MRFVYIGVVRVYNIVAYTYTARASSAERENGRGGRETRKFINEIRAAHIIYLLTHAPQSVYNATREYTWGDTYVLWVFRLDIERRVTLILFRKSTREIIQTPFIQLYIC